MPVKLKYGTNTTRTAAKPSLLHSRLVRGLFIAALGFVAIGGIVFGIFYVHYQHVVDDRLNAGPIFSSVSQIYAAPREVRSGQKLTATAIAADLRQAGYNNNP